MKIALRMNAKGELEAEGPERGTLAEVPDGTMFRIRKQGYQLIVETLVDDQAAEAFLDNLQPQTAQEMIEVVRRYAMKVLERARIFDWQQWVLKAEELNPDTAAAVEVMRRAEHLEFYVCHIKHDLMDDAICHAFDLGAAFETLGAQQKWMSRNPPPSANAKRKAQAEARRNALAEYIREKGERPDKRPGDWYDAFREAHPGHAVTDKTLKADYAHALAMLRKPAKKGAGKRR